MLFFYVWCKVVDRRKREHYKSQGHDPLQHTPDDAQVVVRVGRAVPGEAVEQSPAACSGSELAPDQPVAVLEVSDTGPGIAAQDAARVFERLYRADPSRSRRHGGAGLGLSIVSAIVAAHGGRVELWSGPTGGARFRVLLPLEPVAAEDECGSVDDAEPGAETGIGEVAGLAGVLSEDLENSELALS